MGAPGGDGELAFKSLQVSRTMCAALSLGAGDTALRLVLDFALHRPIYLTGVVTVRFGDRPAETALQAAIETLMRDKAVDTVHSCRWQYRLRVIRKRRERSGAALRCRARRRGERITTSFAALHMAACGTFLPCQPRRAMSVIAGRPAVPQKS